MGIVDLWVTGINVWLEDSEINACYRRFNGDGKLDVLSGGGHVFNGDKGMLYAWTDFAGLLNSPAGNQLPYSAPWPMFRRDATHNGILLLVPDLQVSPTEITIPFEWGQDPTTHQFTITNIGDAGSNLTWNATVDFTGSAADNWFSLDKTTNSVKVFLPLILK